jgi:hypothetical protein
MTKQSLQTLHKSSQQLIRAFHVFMNKVNTSAGRGIIGEILVFDRLIRQYRKSLLSKDNHIKFLGSSIKGHDIEMYIKERKIKINAKGTTVKDKYGKPRWVRQHARIYADISIKDGKTVVKVNKKPKKDLYYVFMDVKVWLKPHKKADFYVLSDKEATQIFGNKYKRLYNNKIIRKTDSDDLWVEYEDIKNFKNNSLSRILKA